MMDFRDEIKNNLQNSLNLTLELLDKLSEEQLKEPIHQGEDRWTALDIFRHISNSEKGLTWQVKNIIEGGEGSAADFDLNRYNSRLREKMTENRDQLKANMIKYRSSLLEVVESLRKDDLKKTGRHATLKIYSVKEFFEIIAWHQVHHIKPIKEKFGYL